MILINNIEVDIESPEEYFELMNSKFDSSIFKEWILVKDEMSTRFELFEDSTMRNMALTYLFQLTETHGACTIQSFLTIHRSILGPYFTMYLKNRIKVDADYNSTYVYPEVLIFEPLGKNRIIFIELANLIAERFELNFIKGRFLNRKLKLENFDNTSLYSFLFGYEGELLDKCKSIGSLNFDPVSNK